MTNHLDDQATEQWMEIRKEALAVAAIHTAVCDYAARLELAEWLLSGPPEVGGESSVTELERQVMLDALRAHRQDADADARRVGEEIYADIAKWDAQSQSAAGGAS